MLGRNLSRKACEKLGQAPVAGVVEYEVLGGLVSFKVPSKEAEGG